MKQLEEIEEVCEARRGLNCLYLALARDIADGISQRVEAAFTAIADQRPHKCTCEKPTAISKDVCGVCGGDLHE